MDNRVQRIGFETRVYRIKCGSALRLRSKTYCSGHTLVQDGHTLVQDGHTLVQDGYTLIQDGYTLVQDGYALVQDGYTLVRGQSNGKTGSLRTVPVWHQR